jgi:O-antigen/teichoic acid export membrane protein
MRYFALIKEYKSYIKSFSFDLLSKFFGILSLPIYLNLMSTQEFGTFNLYFNLISSISLITGLNLYVSFIKNYSSVNSNIEKGSFIFTTICFYLIIILLLGLGFFLNFFDFIFFKLLGKSIDFFHTNKLLIFLLIVSSILSTFLYSYLMCQENLKNFRIHVLVKSILIPTIGLNFLFFLTMSMEFL